MIHIQGDWYIDADPISGYVLAERVEAERKDETGKKVKQFVMSNPTYHRYLKDAFSAYLRRAQRELVHSTDRELKDAVRALQGLTEGVQMLFKEELGQ